MSPGAGNTMTTPSTTAQSLARGSAWITLGEIISALSGLAITVVSARMLAPEAFGLVGIALLVISTLTSLSRTGFDRALVQRPDADSYLNVTFTVQILRGSLLALTILCLGYPAALFYDKPVLFPIFSAMSVGVLCGAFRNPATVYFQRTLDFRMMVLFGTLKALSKMVLVLALLVTLKNVWALVIGHAAGTALDTLLSYLLQKKRARLEWDRAKAKELYHFGKWLTGMSVLGLLVTKGDDIFISKYLGVAALGLYGFAYEIANLPATNVTHVVGRVSFPTYARLYEKKDMMELRRAFFNVMKATVLITGPLSAFLFVNIDGIVAHIVGHKWQPIIPLVRVLVLAGFVRSIAALAAALFQGAGRPHLDFFMNLPRVFLLVFLIWPMCAYFGLQGAAWLTFVAVCSCMPTWLYGLRNIAGITGTDLLRENALGAATTAVVILCFVVAKRLVPPVSLVAFVLQLTLAFGLMGGTMWILQRGTRLRLFDEFRALHQALRKRPA